MQSFVLFQLTLALLAVELEQHLLLLAVELGQVKTVSMYVTGFSTVQTITYDSRSIQSGGGGCGLSY